MPSPSPSSKQVPDEAVEALAAGRRERARGDTLPWAELPEIAKAPIRAEAAADLQAAYPLLVEDLKKRLEVAGVEAMARADYEVHREEVGRETVWEEETQGHRNIYLDAARERIEIALDALPDTPEKDCGPGCIGCEKCCGLTTTDTEEGR